MSRRGTTKHLSHDRCTAAPVVELVGPAAAGKTELMAALRQSDPSLLCGMRVPKSRHLTSVVALLPTFAALHWPPQALLWPEVKRVTYLHTLRRRLEREARAGHRAIVLDEGPIYYLARTLVFGGRRTSARGFQRWWRRSLAGWAHAIDGVVWLDAPDAVLTERVRNRAQSHPVKHLAPAAITSFLASYRRAFERVLHDLAAVNGPRVARFDTSTQSAQVIADHLIGDGLPSARPPR